MLEISKAKDTISKLNENVRADIMMAFYHLSQTAQTIGCINAPSELKNFVGTKEQELLHLMSAPSNEKKRREKTP